MSLKTAISCVAMVLWVGTTAFWLVLLYRILLSVQADEVTWLLYALYIPVALAATTIGSILTVFVKEGK